MPIPTYIPIDKCDPCALDNIEACQTGNYAFGWNFELDKSYRFVITNELGIKFYYDATATGATINWDFSLFPAGWTSSSQTLYVECFDGNDYITPLTFTIGDNPTTYSCFWINFYKAVTV